MNRFKKELRKRGIKLECDYPYLPFDVSESVTLEAVTVRPDQAYISCYYNVVGWVRTYFNRKMQASMDVYLDEYLSYAARFDGTELPTFESECIYQDTDSVKEG